jgi:hypothetical protein
METVSQQTLNPTRVIFPVANVVRGTKRLPEISSRLALERTAQTKVISCPSPEGKVVEAGDFHGLIAAAAIAYQQHYPLALSPDVIWLTILQGVAQHVANHSETLRSRMVSHQTKIELVVDQARIPSTSIEMLSASSAFLELIEKHTLPDKRFLLKTAFSTTTDVERIAGAIVMMDAFSQYFDYVMQIICGIPSVILEGTPADWEILTAKVRLLHESNLELSWWTKHLLPLCDQFERASRGDINQTHWSNLCKLIERYGVDDLNGWILKFIPYVRHDKNESPKHRNPVLELNEFLLDTEKMGKITGCTSNMLPSGLSGTPVACINSQTGNNSTYQFVAGFVGVSQSPEDLSVRPVIGWAITEGRRIDKLIARLRSEHAVQPPSRTATEDLLQIFNRNLPADMWRFFTETGGATMDFKEADHPGIHCNIKAVGEMKTTLDNNCFGHRSEYPTSMVECEERQKMARAYRHLLAFAEADAGTDHFVYFFGRDPEISYEGIPDKESRGNIFRWTGEPTRESFEPVACTFSDWLEAMLEQNKSRG